MEKSMDTDLINGLMVVFIQVCGMIINLVDLENIFGLTEE